MHILLNIQQYQEHIMKIRCPSVWALISRVLIYKISEGSKPNIFNIKFNHNWIFSSSLFP
jgi:hypothetical protein